MRSHIVTGQTGSHQILKFKELLQKSTDKNISCGYAHQHSMLLYTNLHKIQLCGFKGYDKMLQ